MAFELRVAAMKPHELEGAPLEFLGEPPLLSDPEMETLGFYWRLRQHTPSDHPIDLDAALRLHDRLYGPPRDDLALVDDLSALDGEYASSRAEKRPGDGEIGGRRGAGRPKRESPQPPVRPLVRR